MRDQVLTTAGERIAINCELPWVDALIDEAVSGERRNLNGEEPTLAVHIESSSRSFPTIGWEPVTRGAWRLGNEVVMEDVCGSGFDLRLRCGPGPLLFSYRWRPGVRGQVTARVLHSRFILLARAALLQYPALWRASMRERAPLHASVCTAGELRPLLAGPGGVGKSTLLTQELAAGGVAICDNVCVSDGMTAWGLVEPLRVEGGSGRAMPHGRVEKRLNGRVPSLAPDIIVSLRRGDDAVAVVRHCDSRIAARALITGTYIAGELRRYWGFAATLTAGSGLGPAQAPVEEIAQALAARLPAVEVVLPNRPGVRLSELLSRAEAIA
jgi:hypothetical protein